MTAYVVSSGVTSSGIVLAAGDTISVLSAGIASNTVVNNDSVGFVSSGGTAIGSLVSSGGDQFVLSGGIAVGTVLSGGTEQVTSGGVTTGTLVTTGTQIVFAGGLANGTVTRGGVQYLYSGGIASGSTVSSGGELVVDSGGTTNSSVVSSGGTETVYNGGVANSTVVSSGGTQYVSSGGAASDSVIDGGTMEILAGGSVSGSITFGAVSGTLRIDDTTMPAATISGFAIGDTIDLQGVTFVPGDSATFDPGTNVLTVSAGGSTYTLNFDPAQDFSGMPFHLAADGDSSTLLAVACFVRGTHILAAVGDSGFEETAIEQLAIGDRVMTLSGDARPIRWIGRRAYDGRFIAGNRAVLPIRVATGALADGVPARDLFVSPEHALYIDGVFVPAGRLVNGVTIAQCEAVERVEYFHIELDAHDVIFAEGAAAETFVDVGGRAHFHNGAEFAALYPGALPAAWEWYAGLLEAGATRLSMIRAGLLARAEALGRVSRDPDLHLLVDGTAVRAQAMADGVHRFTMAAGTRGVTLASRSVVPIETEADSLDPRRLGVPLERLVLSGDGLRIEITPASPTLSDGFHADEGSHRWTNGSAVLPTQVLACFTGEIALDVQIGATELCYPTAPRPEPETASDSPCLTRAVLRLSGGAG